MKKMSSFCVVLAMLAFAGPSFAGPPCPDCCSPKYGKTAMDSYRILQFKTSTYGTLPAKGKGLRLGVYQAQAAYGPGAGRKNMDRLETVARLAASQGVQLLSFPELYVPGYTLSPGEARKVAEFKDGPSITRARNLAKDLKLAMLLPYAEKAKTKDGLKYYDSIAVIAENGALITSYKKTHLYGQQERDNWSFGDKAPPVFSVFGFRVGVLNCYENEFPELSRMLALKGAKLIVGPTAADCYYTLPNGKRSDVPYPDVSTMLLPAFAYANNVFFAYSNRAGYEMRGKDQWHYRGNSIIIGPHGDVIVAAGHQQDTMLIADCVPSYYGMTHPAPKYDYLRDRRPRMYRSLMETKAGFVPGGYKYPVYKDGKEIR